MVLVEVVERPSDHMSVGVIVAPAEVVGVPTLMVMQENCSSFDWLVEVVEVEAAADLVVAEVPAAAVGTAAGTPAVVVAAVVAVVVRKVKVEVVRMVSQSNRTLGLVVRIILKVQESSVSHRPNCGPSYFLVGQQTTMIEAVVMMTAVEAHCVGHQASSSQAPCLVHCRKCPLSCRTCPSGQTLVEVRWVGVPLDPCRRALPMRRHRSQA